MARVSLAQKNKKNKFLKRLHQSWGISTILAADRFVSGQFTPDRDAQLRYSGMQGSNDILVRPVVLLSRRVFPMVGHRLQRKSSEISFWFHVRKKENKQWHRKICAEWTGLEAPAVLKLARPHFFRLFGYWKKAIGLKIAFRGLTLYLLLLYEISWWKIHKFSFRFRDG